jgi:enediyne biosynthesis protein E4
MLLRHDLVSVLPSLKKKYLKYADYKEQTMEDIFSKEQLSKAIRLDAYTMQSSVFINNGASPSPLERGGGEVTFTRKALPTEAQLSPMYGIASDDFDKDGNIDILMGGNFYQSKPEVGIYDASYGTLLKGDGKGNFLAVAAQRSGINIRGAVRDIEEIKTGRKKIVIVALNNEAPKILEY